MNRLQKKVTSLIYISSVAVAASTLTLRCHDKFEPGLPPVIVNEKFPKFELLVGESF